MDFKSNAPAQLEPRQNDVEWIFPSTLNMPLAMTVEAGNINDLNHFRRTYQQVRRILLEHSMVMATKFIASSLNNLTLTVVMSEEGQKRRFYSNLEP